MPHALTEEQVALLRQALPPTSVTVTSACVCRVLVCGCVGLSWLRLVPLPALVGQECLSLPLLEPAFARACFCSCGADVCVCVCVQAGVCACARAQVGRRRSYALCLLLCTCTSVSARGQRVAHVCVCMCVCVCVCVYVCVCVWPQSPILNFFLISDSFVCMYAMCCSFLHSFRREGQMVHHLHHHQRLSILPSLCGMERLR